jgi:sigma-E factor negative regulatory protein RseA
MVMERISALMDGELEGREAEREVASLKGDPELRGAWDEFHLIRDALQSEPLLASSMSGFSRSFSERLAAEPTILAPHPRRSMPTRRFTTYAMSAAASLAAVTLVAWVALSPTSTPEQQARPAPTLPQIEPARELASVPSDGRMSEYLLAHEAVSPSTALQSLAPYIRTVSTVRQIDRR